MTQSSDYSKSEQENLDAILNSAAYSIAHEDAALLNSNAMRGVRMLLEITKPDLHLEAAGIESTVVVFGGARVTDKDTAAQKLQQVELQLSENPGSSTLRKHLVHAQHLVELSHFL